MPVKTKPKSKHTGRIPRPTERQIRCTILVPPHVYSWLQSQDGYGVATKTAKRILLEAHENKGN